MDLGIEGHLNGSRGFFRFGADAVCYGQAAGNTRPYVNGNLFDALQAVRLDENKVLLPFDVNQVLNNLRYERYVANGGGTWLEAAWAKDAYYRLRPYLPVGLRKHLQRAYLRGWEARTFPNWPVDPIEIDFPSSGSGLKGAKPARFSRTISKRRPAGTSPAN